MQCAVMWNGIRVCETFCLCSAEKIWISRREWAGVGFILPGGWGAIASTARLSARRCLRAPPGMSLRVAQNIRFAVRCARQEMLLR